MHNAIWLTLILARHIAGETTKQIADAEKCSCDGVRKAKKIKEEQAMELNT